MEGFEVVRTLGRGSFARCLLARRKEDGFLYAIKQFLVPFSDLSAREQKEAVDEVVLLAKLDHSNIIRYYDHWITDDVLHIVTEFADGGSLADFLKSGDFDSEMVWTWLVQLVDALHFLHSQRVLHRDLKPANIFVKRGGGHGIVKLGDFGLARALSSQTKMANSVVGTPYYLSPEVVQSKPYDDKSDAWSLGCVLFELLASRRPFEGDNVATLAFNITSGNISCPIPDSADPELARLALQLLTLNPADRLSVTDLYESAAIRGRLKDWRRSGLSCSIAVMEDPGPLSPGYRSHPPSTGAAPPGTGSFAHSGGLVSPSGVGAFDSEEHSAREKLGEEYNLSHNNSLYQWGEGRVKPQLSQPLVQFSVADVVTTSRSVAVRCVDGRVLVWGEGGSGELGLGPRRTSASKPTLLPDLLAYAIAAGQHTLCAVTQGRQLAITGSLCGGTRRSLCLAVLPPGSRCGGGSATHSPGYTLAGSATAFAFPALPTVAVTGTGRDAGAVCVYGRGRCIPFLYGSGGPARSPGSDSKGTEGGEVDDSDEPCVFHPMLVTMLEAVKQAAGGEDFIIALLEDGSLWGWGANACGTLGTGDAEPRDKPTRITSAATLPHGAGASSGPRRSKSGGPGARASSASAAPVAPAYVTGPAPAFRAIAAGSDFVAAVGKVDGQVFTWGNSDEGRLGLVAPEALVTLPHQVGRLQGVDVVSVSLGNAHAAAVDSEGILWCWGANGAGECHGGGGARRTLDTLKEPRRVTHGAVASERCMSVSCGHRHTLVNTEAKRVFAFGWGSGGRLGFEVSGTAGYGIGVLSPGSRASRTDDYDDDYDDDEPEELTEGRGDAEREDAEFGLQVHEPDVHAEAGQVPLQSSCVRIHAGVFNDLGYSFAVCVPTGGRFGK